MAPATDAVALRLGSQVGQGAVGTARGTTEPLADQASESGLQGLVSPLIVERAAAAERETSHRLDENLNAPLAPSCRLRLADDLERVGITPDQKEAVPPQPHVEDRHHLVPVLAKQSL